MNNEKIDTLINVLHASLEQKDCDIANAARHAVVKFVAHGKVQLGSEDNRVACGSIPILKLVEAAYSAFAIALALEVETEFTPQELIEEALGFLGHMGQNLEHCEVTRQIVTEKLAHKGILKDHAPNVMSSEQAAEAVAKLEAAGHTVLSVGVPAPENAGPQNPSEAPADTGTTH